MITHLSFKAEVDYWGYYKPNKTDEVAKMIFWGK